MIISNFGKTLKKLKCDASLRIIFRNRKKETSSIIVYANKEKRQAAIKRYRDNLPEGITARWTKEWAQRNKQRCNKMC